VVPEATELVLGLALIRPAAFEVALEKVVEVGVSRVVPFGAARSNVSSPRRTDRWVKIVIEAAKQSKRYWLPVVEDPVEFGRIVSFPAATRVVFTERGGGPLPDLGGGSVLYVVGPEGGWTDGELQQLNEKGFAAVSLGDGILKAETAAIVGGALIRYVLEQGL
jgi:16S rRNA (uracil1498-N3)-methyltransferase